MQCIAGGVWCKDATLQPCTELEMLLYALTVTELADTGGSADVPPLRFLAVTLGLGILFHFLLGVLPRNQVKVRQRLAEEFGTGNVHGARSALYKDVDSLSLVAAEEDCVSLRLHARHVPRPLPPSLRKRLENLLEQANAPLSIGPFVLLAAAFASWQAPPITLWEVRQQAPTTL